MKKLILSLTIGLSLTASAQQLEKPQVVFVTNYVTVTTNAPHKDFFSGPLTNVVNFLGQGSNWIVFPYGIYSSGGVASDKAEFGGGIGLGYKLNDFMVPTLRLDYLNKQLWMPSASLQLQAPVTILDGFTGIPFVFAGISTPISGAGDQNGTAVGIYGAGLAVRVSKHFDLLADYEKWSSFNGYQLRFGLGWKPKAW